MPGGLFTPGEWLVLAQHELLLFAGIFFMIGAFDELAVDIVWLYLKVTGRAATQRLASDADNPPPLAGQAAVFIAAWREAEVIGATVRHILASWPQADLRLYVGTYRNDSATAHAVIAAAGDDPRLRLVVHDRDGPTTKADCLNCIYQALVADERRSGRPARMVVMHDAEDMVDPAALALLDAAIGEADLVQLPVLPEPLPQSRWIASHYCEEFAEAHGKAMVVRNWLGAGIPTAGVGCAISRAALAQMAERSGGDSPFDAESLTEDYELGLAISDMGRPSRPRWPIGGNPCVLSEPARIVGAPENSLDSWDRAAIVGPARLEWAAGRHLDAAARPAGATDRARACHGLPATRGGYG